ncbi:MAG: cobalt ECF transporter T component CbiQ [Actinomycetota bacterium]|nr:cobalt ECF transporter T component CbiQ [Actinomycetota bacterium]
MVHGHSPLHLAAPQCKVAAALLFVLIVVVTPREAFWAFGAYATGLVALTFVTKVPPTTLVRRLVIELPFLIFVIGLPLLARGERSELLGISYSVEGLWAAWNIVAKSTLGTTTMVLLASTTSITSILQGMQRLRVPSVFVAVAGFMIRYGDVIASEMRRMRVARESRGYEARWLWQTRALASSAGTLFIRSYERGERVHLAMLSRGYGGSMPELSDGRASASEWAMTLTFPLAAAAVCAVAWLQF